MINLNELPREVRDRIELREQTDPTFYRFCDNSYTEEFWNTLMERSDKEREHSVIISINGMQGAGKSWAAIAMARFVDPDFSVDRIFFSYDELVRYRAKLKDHCAVVLDEQTQSYGLDSNRVMIILNSLKEQLRKKSIHLFFCSPVLHAESATSMYIMEVMFIDQESQETYAALKTREGQTLGHVQIPSPLKVLEDGTSLASEELMKAYEAKKSAHLDRLLGQKSVDVFEERAEAVIQSALFKKANKIYRAKLGYIPRDRIVQIVNKLFPEYNASVVPQEIAERIRMNMELAGLWVIPGSKKKGD